MIKKLCAPGLAALLVISALAFNSSTNTASAQGAGLVASIINRMERNRTSLRSLRANITMEKWNSQIRDKDDSKGMVIYMPGSGQNSYVRVDWQYPQKEVLAVADGKYTLYRPRLGMAYEGSANSNRNKVSGVLGFGLNISRQQLASKFETQYVGEETLWGDVRTSHLKLVPKGGAGYRHAEIWVDSDGMPVQTKVVEKNDDATTIRLMDVERNARLSSDEFRLQLDSNVKRVRS
ncbi:MAG: outer-membrane lipoprotein carrier protein LolA [Pyrinomonadaceae bacterium]